MKLGELCKPKQWKSLKQSDMMEVGYPVYGANGIIGFYHEYNHPNETILVGCRGTCGEVNVCRPESYVTSNAMCLDNLADCVDMGYLVCFLKAYDFRKVIGGTSQPQITKSGISSIEVPIYPLDIQLTIRSKLESVLNQITYCKKIEGSLDSLIKSRFVEMFGDPCDSKSEKKRSRIDSFCELRIGPFGSALHKEDYVSDGHPLVNPSHIINGTVRPDWDLTITDDKFESLAAYHLFPGDVVLGRRGEIGRCAVVDKSGMICGTGSMILRPGRKVRSDYLQRVVSFPSFSRALEINAVGVTMKNLNAKIVGSAEVHLPELKDQDAFAAFANQVDKSRFVRDHEMNFR